MLLFYLNGIEINLLLISMAGQLFIMDLWEHDVSSRGEFYEGLEALYKLRLFNLITVCLVAIILWVIHFAIAPEVVLFVKWGKWIMTIWFIILFGISIVRILKKSAF